jgi:hypothetical protein
LKGLHPHLAHQRHRIEGEIPPAPRNVGADHRKKALGGLLGPEQMGCGKLRVVGYGVCSANFKLNPEAEGVIEPLEDDIRTGGVA